MVKVVDLNMNPDIEDLMLASVKTKNRYYSTSVIDRKIAVGGRQYNVLKGRSYMKTVSNLWHCLSQEDRDSWSSVAQNCNLSGWQLFLQDTSFRISAGLPGFANLSQFHQYNVGFVSIPADLSDYYITQYHYLENSVWVKNVGQKNAYTYTKILEEKTFPLTIEFNYYCDFIENGASPDIHVRVYMVGYKDSVITAYDRTFSLDLQSDWSQFSEIFDEDLDSFIYYIVSFVFSDVDGIFLFDNCNFFHDSQNWAFDPFCTNINFHKYITHYDDSLPWEGKLNVSNEYYGSIYFD